ncbi:MAG: asparagine synthase-related protein [Pseudomonadota bacterium]
MGNTIENTVQALSEHAGFVVATGDLVARVRRQLDEAGVADNLISVAMGDWFRAYLIAGPSSSRATVGGVDVLVDGYISDCTLDHRREDLLEPARFIAEQTDCSPSTLAQSLRGSFAILRVDTNQQCAQLICDRRVSRPHFHTALGRSEFVLAPSLRLASLLSSEVRDVDEVALSQFLISRHFYYTKTLLSGISKMPPAGLLTVERPKTSLARYWRVSSLGAECQSDADALDSCITLVGQALRRVLVGIERPFLFLSGGMDSRLLLAAMLANKSTMPCVSYGLSSAADTDRGVATQICNTLNLNQHDYQLESRYTKSRLLSMVARIDGQGEVIDSPGLFPIWNKLGSQFGGCVNGDEVLERNAPADSLDEVRAGLGMFAPHRVARLRDWYDPQAWRRLLEADGEFFDQFATELGAPDLLTLKRWLFFEHKVVNYQNSYSTARAKFFEQCRPLLDEDIVDWANRLSPAMVRRKRIFAEATKQLSPQLAEIPLATNASISTAPEVVNGWREVEEFSEDVTNGLRDNLDPRIARHLNESRIAPAVKAMCDGVPLPPIQATGLYRLPGMWRLRPAYFHSAISPQGLMLRLHQANRYLMLVD